MTFAVTWSANIFVGCSVTPTFFGISLPFLILSIILKNEKNLYVGSFNFFSYTIQIGSNWYMDTGVRDLEVAFKANSTWFDDKCSKDLLNRPIYAVLNTHNLLLIQLKYMPIVMNPPESPRVTRNPRNAMVYDAPYLQNECGDPRFFLRF